MNCEYVRDRFNQLDKLEVELMAFIAFSKKICIWYYCAILQPIHNLMISVHHKSFALKIQEMSDVSKNKKMNSEKKVKCYLIDELLKRRN